MKADLWSDPFPKYNFLLELTSFEKLEIIRTAPPEYNQIKNFQFDDTSLFHYTSDMFIVITPAQIIHITEESTRTVFYTSPCYSHNYTIN